MIHEVDEALRVLIRADPLAGGQVSVVFDAPTRDWAAKVNAPTVNLYLYDIREDMRRRERGLLNEYDEHGTVTARRRPPRYFKLSYLITAWTRRPEDEHRLLSALLLCLLRYEALPPDRLTGTLAGLGVSVPMSVALPPPEDRSFADVWSALGGELKPSLDLVISVPVTESPVYPAGPPVGDDGLRLGFSDGVRGPAAAPPVRRMPGGAGLPVYGGGSGAAEAGGSGAGPADAGGGSPGAPPGSTGVPGTPGTSPGGEPSGEVPARRSGISSRVAEER